uniref:RE55185p n=1 Tax=Drosophila melanogaster TaxID=7227 RepID=D9PTW5_DROME|nr:RE55185p [Drosophila melanogaster]
MSWNSNGQGLSFVAMGHQQLDAVEQYLEQPTQLPSNMWANPEPQKSSWNHRVNR